MNDGGPAFPVTGYPGMTLRDYFAAAAMQGLLAKAVPVMVRSKNGCTLSTAQDNLGEISYQIADDMIDARKP